VANVVEPIGIVRPIDIGAESVMGFPIPPHLGPRVPLDTRTVHRSMSSMCREIACIARSFRPAGYCPGRYAFLMRGRVEWMRGRVECRYMTARTRLS
jgi:hypothetical protein